MEHAVTAADANRGFSSLLRRVREGETVVITSRGSPVAKMVPVIADEERRAVAREALFARLREQAEQPGVVTPWTRDELYER